MIYDTGTTITAWPWYHNTRNNISLDGPQRYNGSSKSRWEHYTHTHYDSVCTSPEQQWKTRCADRDVEEKTGNVTHGGLHGGIGGGSRLSGLAGPEFSTRLFLFLFFKTICIRRNVSLTPSTLRALTIAPTRRAHLWQAARAVLVRAFYRAPQERNGCGQFLALTALRAYGFGDWRRNTGGAGSSDVVSAGIGWTHSSSSRFAEYTEIVREKSTGAALREIVPPASFGPAFGVMGPTRSSSLPPPLPAGRPRACPHPIAQARILIVRHVIFAGSDIDSRLSSA